MLNRIKFLVSLCSIFTTIFGKGSAITVSKDYAEFSARGIGQTLAHCLGAAQKIDCLEAKVLNTLDKALYDNSTWQLSDFLLFERNTAELANASGAQQRSMSDRIGDRLLQLVQSRSLRLRLPPVSDLLSLQAYSASISNAVDDFAAATEEVVNVDAAAAAAAPQGDEGRKKKDKDKHMAMMGGMTIVAMLAQMFLGKVILIAGAAFVMAKIALLISVLGSLKKGQMGSSGGTEHVIVTSGGGGGGHSHDSSGWHRSMPYELTKIEEIAVSDDHEDHDHDEHDEHHISTSPTTESGGWTAGWNRRMTERDSERKVDAIKSQQASQYINHRLNESGDFITSTNKSKFIGT